MGERVVKLQHLLIASALVALGVGAFLSYPAHGTFAEGGGLLEVVGLGGGPVTAEVTNRVDVSATTAPGVYLAVAGDSSGTILRTELGSASLNTLLAPVCTRGRPEVLLINNAPAQLPTDAGHADPATRWTMVNLSNNRELCCLPSLDGGAGDLNCSSLAYIVPAGATLNIDGQQLTHTVHCKVNNADPLVTARVNVWEEACAQP